MEKKEALRRHSKKRMRERFGIAGNHRDYARIVEAIRTQTAKFIGRASHRVSVFMVDSQTGPMKVLYDGRRGEVITVLTPDMHVTVRPTRNAEVSE